MSKQKTARKRKFFDRRYIKEEKRWRNKWTLIALGSLAMFFFFYDNVINTSIITETSMFPTLKHGEYYGVNRYIFRLRPPRRGEIITFRERNASKDRYVKRVIAVEGDALEIRGGEVFLNGEKLIEPYAFGPTLPDMGPITIEAETLFAMGDNRPDSLDSRSFGPVAVRYIEGKIDPKRWFAWD